MAFTIQTPEQLSAHLIALREQAGLTQAELGLMIGVGQPRMAKIENDPLSISVGRLLQIFGLLNASMQIEQRPRVALKASDLAKDGIGDFNRRMKPATPRVPARAPASALPYPMVSGKSAKQTTGPVQSEARRLASKGVAKVISSKNAKAIQKNERTREDAVRRVVGKGIASEVSSNNAKKSSQGNW